MNEYQLIYIPEGAGYFESESCRRRKIAAGTMFLLFPDEWHTYEPEQESDWFEYWVGFCGAHIDNRVKSVFFSPADPLFHLGFKSTILGLYEEILNHASEEKADY